MIGRSAVFLMGTAFLASCDSSVENSAEATEVVEAASSLSVGPNDGYVFKLVGADGKTLGTAEIKLHDDKGDLEVWINQGDLAESVLGASPWDLGLDYQLMLEFPELEKDVTLAARDSDTNADEAGKSMIRDGKTNYFIFPGDTGVDASWLQGHHFEETAVLTFEVDGAMVTTNQVTLSPHGHHDHAHGDGHDHPHPH